MKKGLIGIWMYKNQGGEKPRSVLIDRLQAEGYEVIADFDMRKCYCLNNAIMTENGRDLSKLNLLFHMNADERSEHQNSILRALEMAGVRLLNPYVPHEIARDKFVSNFMLQQAGINVPPSILVNNEFSEVVIKNIFDQWGSVLLKPRRWYGAKGIIKFDDFEQFIDFALANKNFYTQYFLQKFIPFNDHDYRVELIDGKVMGCYNRRKNHSYKTNYHAGGGLISCADDENKILLAKQAAAALNIPITIVDIVQSVVDDRPYVLEVNDTMGVFIESLARYFDEKIYDEFAYDQKKIDMLVEYINLQMEKIRDK